MRTCANVLYSPSRMPAMRSGNRPTKILVRAARSHFWRGIIQRCVCCASDAKDIIDEAIYLFRAQVLFKSFAPDGSGDITLIYLTLFIQQCIQVCTRDSCAGFGWSWIFHARSSQTVKRARDAKEANTLLFSLANSDFAAPGDSGFPLGGFVSAAKNREESNEWKAYFKDVRPQMRARRSMHQRPIIAKVLGRSVSHRCRL